MLFPQRLNPLVLASSLFFLTSFAVPVPVCADTPNPSYIANIAGVVELVDDDGSIMLVGSEKSPFHHFKLWGLEVKDVQGLRSFIVGRLVECRVVHSREPIPEADCLLHPQVDGETVYRPTVSAGGFAPRNPIPVFDWIVDFGFAVQKCIPYSNHDYISDGAGYYWYCSQEGIPDYSSFSYGNLP
jgi:hypothetical protein